MEIKRRAGPSLPSFSSWLKIIKIQSAFNPNPGPPIKESILEAIKAQRPLSKQIRTLNLLRGVTRRRMAVGSKASGLITG